MIHFTDAYQTLPLPDGNVLNGIFQTIEWFERASAIISFQDQVVLDLGCSMSSFGIQAVNKGARLVVGVDNDPKRISQSHDAINIWKLNNTVTALQYNIEEYTPLGYDIIIFSMIIHWLKDPEFHIRRFAERCKSKLVFIFRYSGSSAGYCPTIDELDILIGRKRIHNEKLSDTPEQNIMLAIYDVTNTRS